MYDQKKGNKEGKSEEGGSDGEMAVSSFSRNTLTVSIKSCSLPVSPFLLPFCWCPVVAEGDGVMLIVIHFLLVNSER